MVFFLTNIFVLWYGNNIYNMYSKYGLFYYKYGTAIYYLYGSYFYFYYGHFYYKYCTVRYYLYEINLNSNYGLATLV